MIIRKSVYIAPRDETTVGQYVYLDHAEAAALAAGGTVVIGHGGLPSTEIIITTVAHSPVSEQLVDSMRAVPA